MIDITHKSNTLRYAHATAELRVSKAETIERVQNNAVPKGNIFEMSKAAGLFAVKQTHQVIPDCHPLPIEFAAVTFEIKDLSIHIHMEVKTIYKTGVEVEAMHGASVVALTIYDMLKPIDKGIEIHGIKLLEKTGGKTSYKPNQSRPFKAAVVVCSDSISAGKKEDKSGVAISDKLQKLGIEVAHYSIISDDESAILQQVEEAKNNNFDLLIFTGGTGLSPRDKTPETILPLLHREIPGIAEQIRSYGQLRTPYSMLSRSVCGLINNMLVMTLPGSTKGASESMDAIFPAVLHIFRVLDADFKH
jgi:cyclic pyranopterin monophosphate synthase